ncbi:MAG TPA: pitrilysin family protein [Allosphingosinicella sp.]|nr:pitrilysin family protein [Allosphingosinicella sp.]
MVQGRLDNGLRYAVLPREASEPGVGLLVRIEGGFIAEQRPGERGLAHLIEHLFTVSPTTSAPDELRHFARIGLPLSFPAPSVGTTNWRETNYFLSTRTTSTADLDTLLALFRETASDLTFRPDAVDEQRADVMREMAERRPGNEVNARYLAAVAPGSPGDVLEGQNSDDVPTASIETIRALYHRLYRPENMMVVVVGEVDPAQVTALIRQRFGGWQGVGPAPVRAAAPTFQPSRIAPVSHSDAQQGRRVAMVTLTMPTPPTPPTRRGQAERLLMDMLAVRAFNNALHAAQPDAPPGKFGLFIENGEYGHRLFLFWDHFEPGEGRRAIAGLSAMTCRLRTRGLTAQEWAAARRDVVIDLEQRTREMGRVPNVELAKDLSHALADGQELIPPDELLRHASAWFPTIGRQEANGWWRRQWRAGVDHMRVEAPELAQVPDPGAAIRAAADGAVADASCTVRRS